MRENIMCTYVIVTHGSAHNNRAHLFTLWSAHKDCAFFWWAAGPRGTSLSSLLPARPGPSFKLSAREATRELLFPAAKNSATFLCGTTGATYFPVQNNCHLLYLRYKTVSFSRCRHFPCALCGPQHGALHENTRAKSFNPLQHKHFYWPFLAHRRCLRALPEVAHKASLPAGARHVQQ